MDANLITSGDDTAVSPVLVGIIRGCRNIIRG